MRIYRFRDDNRLISRATRCPQMLSGMLLEMIQIKTKNRIMSMSHLLLRKWLSRKSDKIVTDFIINHLLLHETISIFAMTRRADVWRRGVIFMGIWDSINGDRWMTDDRDFLQSIGYYLSCSLSEKEVNGSWFLGSTPCGNFWVKSVRFSVRAYMGRK